MKPALAAAVLGAALLLAGPLAAAELSLAAPLAAGVWPLAGTPALAAARPGQTLTLALPSGARTLIVRRVIEHAAGSRSLVLEQPDGEPAGLVTAGPGSALTGSLELAGERWWLEQRNGQARLVDPQRQALPPPPPQAGDARRPPAQGPRWLPGASLARTQAQPLAASTVVTATVFFYTTPELRQLYGSAAGVQARLDHLLTYANEAFARSGVALALRQVGHAEVATSASQSNVLALDAFTPRLIGAQATGRDAGERRFRRAADFVALIRPYLPSHDSCGNAWLLTHYARGERYSAYQVSATSDRALEGGGCFDHLFTHEIGHNLGLAHDRAHGGGGVFEHAFGYGIPGRFGTIMSYLAPVLGRFSNPRQTDCAGGPCGVPAGEPDAADNAGVLQQLRRHYRDSLPLPPGYEHEQTLYRGLIENPPFDPGPVALAWRLTAEPQGEVTLRLSVDDPQVSLSRRVLRFTPRNWFRVQSSELSLSDDSLAQGDRLATVRVRYDSPQDARFARASERFPVALYDDERP
ncbi:MAG TPA: M12 family metallo-peptidase [Nevskiaceae bacterium]|nr:M12 family metallo-peptidase [Nevskiaceae bacterium]